MAENILEKDGLDLQEALDNPPEIDIGALTQHIADALDVLSRLEGRTLSAEDQSIRQAARVQVNALTAGVHIADMADVFEQLNAPQRPILLDVMGDSFDPEILSELDETVRDELVATLQPNELAAAVTELDADDAVYVLEDMDDQERQEVLLALDPEDRAEVQLGLSYPEDSAARLMQRDFISVPEFWTVGQTIDYMRETDDLPNEFYEIFVVDPMNHLSGRVPLNQVLRAKRPVKITDIMDADLTLIPADMDQEEVGRLFQKYDLVSAPVVDEENRLLGSIMVDDIVEVVTEEAEEDILRLGGVSDEGSIYESALRTTRNRFTWLLINLGTAILASVVIGMFDATIEQMVALAVLMPIVASMGGNAGTQTLTIAVRALATKELTGRNAFRTANRELVVGLLNGLAFALLMGLVAGLWFGDWMLAVIIGIAMVINLAVAALAGLYVPVMLDRAGVDPAVASSVFVTTVTDVVGFLAFLGLAALILL